jgi:hypothetical protein
MILNHVDAITKKPIQYDENSIFVIYLKGGYHKKRPIRFFTHAHVREALDFFYALDVPLTKRKYFMIHHKDHLSESEGKLIYNMKGYYPNAGELKLKLGRHLVSYRYRPTLNLVKTPETLAKKIDMFDFSTLPVKHEKWSKTKLVYCLLAYFFSLNEQDRYELMDKSFKLFTAEKLQSGGKDTDASELRELVRGDIL